MYISLLGRQPELSIAELERVFTNVSWFSAESARINTDEVIDIQRLGGSQKIGRISLEIPSTDWRTISTRIVRHYSDAWKTSEGKITLGLSAYGFTLPGREIQKTGLLVKSNLKKQAVSVRLIPNQDAALSTATAHHNKLGLSATKVELLIIKGRNSTIVAESIGTQNIPALAARDQGRPRRDAFVGMLPPKLAQMMVNFALGPKSLELHKAHNTLRVLDPFCGTGVLLQEAALLGASVYGTDLSEKMIRYSQDNLAWLENLTHSSFDWKLAEGDAMTTQWQQPIDAVATETYLGQPFSAPPSKAKLTEVRGNCNHIIGSFLRNIVPQLETGTCLALAVPAWRDTNGNFTHLPLTQQLDSFGLTRIKLTTVESDRLLYARPDQVVAREILLVTKQ